MSEVPLYKTRTDATQEDTILCRWHPTADPLQTHPRSVHCRKAGLTFVGPHPQKAKVDGGGTELSFFGIAWVFSVPADIFGAYGFSQPSTHGKL